jgi:hypothetical protein
VATQTQTVNLSVVALIAPIIRNVTTVLPREKINALMNNDLKENLSITLSKAAWLVLFEWLMTSNAEWSKANPDSHRLSPKPLQLTADHPQRVALWWLENAIENRLPFLLNAELLEEAKRLLAGRD